MSESGYQVVWPLGKLAFQNVALKPRLADLNGKTICELSDYSFRGEEIFPIVREELRKIYPRIKFVEHTQFGNTHGSTEAEVIRTLPTTLKEHGCDAVISGVGGWGSCTPAVVRASVAAEKAGFPTTSIVLTGFLTQAKAVAQAMGIKNIAIAEYPGIVAMDSKEELRCKVSDILVKNIIAGFTRQVEDTAQRVEPAPRDIVFTGSLDAVQEFFYNNTWTDGLPIIPPTLEKVDAFLKFTSRSSHEIIGKLLPENREATVWNVAVNGVMAGCRPEYMPILLAAVDAIADPEFRIQDGGATPGWEPLIILNGPIIKQLGFNYETGVMRVGRQANTSIGRFLKLYMMNIAGLRIPPGLADKATIGSGFNVVLPENEDIIAELGWESFSMSRGFSRNDNVVTVQSVVYATAPMATGGEKAVDHLETLSEVIGGNMAPWTHVALNWGKFYPLIVISPGVARFIAKEGIVKNDIKQYLYDHTKVSVKSMERLAHHGGLTSFYVDNLVADGIAPKAYSESHDPDRMVPVFLKPEWIGVVVSGDPGRTRCRGYVQNHEQGPPVSRKIILPPDWEHMIPAKPV